MDWQKLDKEWQAAEPAKEAGGWALVPDGTSCKLVIVDQGPHTKKKKTGDSHSLKTVFEVVEPEEYAGVRIWNYFGLSEERFPYTKRDLAICGWKGDKVSVLWNADDSTLIGKGCVAILGIDADEGTYTDETTGETKKKKKKNIIKVFKETWVMPVSQGQAAAQPPREPDDAGFDPNNPPF
jgi:hypothetical protein